ncbi:MAG: sigma-70 family RNA polymerase sigma factor [Lachnospiraceae bacterium]|nr:sigma-70 family RNA polymerase sigma factor [Lachnospiraceae bacterium]MBQ9593029.1 sigma-70 family RNA polymerase sigma factor [Lachnospiraceae bacterium]
MSEIDQLLEQYKPLVLKKARTLYLAGGDRDDLIQEGMIGLYKAIRDYDEALGMGFPAFADLCVTRQLYSAIRSDAAQKNAPLNRHVEFAEESVRETAASPEEVVLGQEMAVLLEKSLQEKLSGFEQTVLELYLQDQDYRQIAETLGKAPKTIDNALQRIRAKARKVLEEYE